MILFFFYWQAHLPLGITKHYDELGFLNGDYNEYIEGVIMILELARLSC